MIVVNTQKGLIVLSTQNLYVNSRGQKIKTSEVYDDYGILCDVMLKNPTYTELYEVFRSVCSVVNKRKRVRLLYIDMFKNIMLEILRERKGIGWIHGGHKYPGKWVQKCTSSRVWWGWYTKGKDKYVRILGDRVFLSSRGCVVSPFKHRYEHLLPGEVITPFWVVFPRRMSRLFNLREKRIENFLKKRRISVDNLIAIFLNLKYRVSKLYPLAVFRVIALGEREVIVMNSKTLWLIMNPEESEEIGVIVELPKRFGPWSKFYQQHSKQQLLGAAKGFALETMLRIE